MMSFSKKLNQNTDGFLIRSVFCVASEQTIIASGANLWEPP
jgi:hypothetical protein